MRPRKKDKHLPKCVYYHHGAYWLVKQNRWTRLGKTLPKEYERKVGRPRTSLSDLIDAALAPIKAKVSPSTWGNYTSAAEKLKDVFQNLSPHEITTADVWEFRDLYASTPNMTNRCLTVLTEVMNYAVRRRIVAQNPVFGVDKHDEAERERLITHQEYAAIYAEAGPRLRCIMDVLYLTGQRVNDVLKLRRDALTDEGIYFRQQKTGKKLLVRWTPELRDAIDRAKALTADVPTLTVFSGRGRKAPDYRSVKLQWDNACAAAKVSDAQMRDLRAMSLTSTEDEGKNPTALAGHSSEAMTKRYLRGKKVAKVDGPSFKRG